MKTKNRISGDDSKNVAAGQFQTGSAKLRNAEGLPLNDLRNICDKLNIAVAKITTLMDVVTEKYHNVALQTRSPYNISMAEGMAALGHEAIDELKTVDSFIHAIHSDLLKKAWSRAA